MGCGHVRTAREKVFVNSDDLECERGLRRTSDVSQLQTMSVNPYLQNFQLQCLPGSKVSRWLSDLFDDVLWDHTCSTLKIIQGTLIHDSNEEHRPTDTSVLQGARHNLQPPTQYGQTYHPLGGNNKKVLSRNSPRPERSHVHLHSMHSKKLRLAPRRSRTDLPPIQKSYEMRYLSPSSEFVSPAGAQHRKAAEYSPWESTSEDWATEKVHQLLAAWTFVSMPQKK